MLQVAVPELFLSVTVALAGLAFSGYLARWVRACFAGDGDMPHVAAAIRALAETVFRRLSNVVVALCALLGGAIFLAYGLLPLPDAPEPKPAVSPLEMGVWLTLSFASGVGCAVLTGRVATFAATRTSVRAAAAARRSVDQALRVALRGGAVSGVFSSALDLAALCALVAAVLVHRGALGADPTTALRVVADIPFMIAGYALGACYAALLAQLGGGAFGASADVGADAAGREHGFEDDDAKNPAAKADLAGDAVGGCAARASGVFASTAVETIAAMLLGAALFRANPEVRSAQAVILLPLMLRAFGLIGAAFGVLVVRTDDREDPISALGRGLLVTAVLHLVAMAGIAKWILGAAWLRLFACGAIGAGLSVAVLRLALHEVDPARAPVRRLADAARAGPVAAVLRGLERGMASTLMPGALIVAAALCAYRLGASTGLVGGGAFGVAVATLGALGTGTYLLSVDAFGAIADGASGIIEMCMARERPDVRGRAMVLDAAGNAMKTLAKAHGAAVSGLATVLVVAAFLEEAARRLPVSLAGTAGASNPLLPLGAVLGVLFVVWFSARCVGMVGVAACRVTDEARREIMTRAGRTRDAEQEAARSHAASPDGSSRRPPSSEVPPHSCIEVAAGLALRQMILPGIVAAAYPVAVGLGLRFAAPEDNPRLAIEALAALITGGTIAGVLGALFLGNAGGAWDNAKKYIATGACGGRYLVDATGARSDNPTWSAAAVADAIGDPLKDTAAPAAHVLVKMIAAVAIVFLPFFV